MATITSAGIGSGLDVNGLVKQLVAAEGQPVSQRLDRKEATLQAQLTAWGSVKGALSGFQSSLSGLTSAVNFNKRSTGVSDTTILSATASSTAVSGSYSIEVGALAKAHSLASAQSFDSVSDSVGTGTLTFRFGAWSGGAGSYSFDQNAEKAEKSIVIDSSNNSLTGLRDAINEAAFGVRASIVNDGTGYRLVLSSTDTGAKNGLEVTVSGTPTGEVANFAFDAATRNDVDVANNLAQTVAAQDASFTVNGLAVSSATNVVTNSIPGVTLTLRKEAVGTPVTVDVSQDKASVSTAISGFVEGYNNLAATLKELSAYNAETKQGGILIGDSTLRSIQSGLRNIIGQRVTGVSGPYSTLADLGITTTSDGKLKLDTNKLDTALAEHFDDVAGLFTAYGRPSDSLVSYSGSTAATKPGKYALSVTALARQGYFEGNAGITAVTLDSSNKTFVVRVDGLTSGTITLNEGTYDSDLLLADLAAQMQSKINGDAALAGSSVSVTYDTTLDRFVLTSNRYGSASKVEIGTANALLGLDSSGTSTDGIDVAGSLGGVTASGDGRFLTGVAGSGAGGLKVEVLGGNTGSRGTVSFARGIANQLNDLVGGFLARDGLVTTRTEGAQGRIEDITEQREVLARRLTAIEKRYRAQFSALDTLLGQMQATSNYLSNQLSALPGAYSGSSDK